MCFVAYLRVSTDKQGVRGLGMDAQQTAVTRFVAASRGSLLAQYVEVESGKRADRPELQQALDHAKQARATLLIAKLDRLSRNVAFISRLLESGVELLCCDMPQANRLTLHILAAVAEHERQMISERTKAALAAAKARGIRLGAPHGSDPSAARAERTRSAAAFRDRAAPEVARLAGQGLSLQRIAAELNRLGSVTSTGKPWRPAAVWRVLASERSAATVTVLHEPGGHCHDDRGEDC